MRKVKIFFDQCSNVFENEINDFLERINIQKIVEIQYKTGSIGDDFFFTAMIFYEE